MKKFPLHSSVFLLLLFVFPQVNNALHYFVVEHHFHAYDSNEKQYYHKNQTHDCEQSIFKTPSILLLDLEYTELIKTVLFFKKEKFGLDLFHNIIFFKNPSNRGPP